MKLKKIILRDKDKLPFFYQKLTIKKSKTVIFSRNSRIDNFEYYKGRTECHEFYKPISRLFMLIVFLISCHSQKQSENFPCIKSDFFKNEMVFGYYTNTNGKKDSVLLEEIKWKDQVYKVCRKFIFETKINLINNRVLIDTFEMYVTGNKFSTKDLQKEIIYKINKSNIKSKEISVILEKLKMDKISTIVNIEKTGLKEREDQVWLHPIRINQYIGNEIAPFPCVKFPLEIGETWSNNITIGKGWGPWENVNIHSEYKVIDTITLIWKNNEKFKCWKILAQSNLENSEIIVNFFYNEQIGFMQIEQNFFNEILTKCTLIDIVDI